MDNYQRIEEIAREPLQRMKELQQDRKFAQIDGPYFKMCAKNFNQFFKQGVSEKFAQKVLQQVFDFHSVRHGEHGTEADLIFDEKEAFEITLISDKKKHGNFVQRIVNRFFHSEDVESEVLALLKSSIERKLKKKYRTQETNLCLILPVPIMNWIELSPIIELLYNNPRKIWFKALFNEYVVTKKLKNVYVLLPGMDCLWYLIDFKDFKEPYQGDLEDEDYPYFQLISYEEEQERAKK